MVNVTTIRLTPGQPKSLSAKQLRRLPRSVHSGGSAYDVAVTRRFLTQDYMMSQEGETRIDCRDHCFACGILPKFKDMRREIQDDAWECPPVTRIADRKKPISSPTELLRNSGKLVGES
ncbi:MAG: hypothetical protein BMS9Abin02_1364 [Anaerolineae bacterium]|nr:MAG: hypothetical protein BMS9Abin02_1364 [Anaerolineae bacterium]